MISRFVLGWLLLFLYCWFAAATLKLKQEDEQTKQAEALMAFKSLIKQDPHGVLAEWDPSLQSYCNWTGIICTSIQQKHDAFVTAINLTGMGLVGTLSPFLGNLTSLQSLDLSRNGFHGSVPAELGSLSQLQSLSLARNRLSGSIPTSFRNLSKMITLELSENTVGGDIPPQLGLLRHLKILGLDQNAFKGSIPPALSNLSALEELHLATNSLTGQIPWEFGAKLKNLNILMLFTNQLSGNIPGSLGNCSKLIKLILSRNQLSGSIPLGLGKLSLLERLKLHMNYLDNGNKTDMPVITALTNCSSLQQLTLGDNKLRGLIPHTIGRLSPVLSLLYLTNNSIYGSIPPEIGNLTGLTYLALSRNNLTGSIPSLRRLKILERLRLQRNQLEGPIPEHFGQLKYLGILDLSGNRLSGQIPSTLGSLDQLRRVFLHHNQLSGNIPSSIGDCSNMEQLDLSYNLLNGSIPKEISRLHNLQFYLNLSANLLQGSLPAEIGNLAMVMAIDVSSNNLTNKIPDTIGSCSGLEYLNLSRNNFEGEIPASLRHLKNLIHLDLSFNSLSGTVPIEAFRALQTVALLDASYNNLAGEIPESYVTGNHTAIVSLVGNPDLCGPSRYSIPACPIIKGHMKLLVKVLLAVMSAVALSLCITIIICVWRKSSKKLDVSVPSFHEMDTRRVSYRKLFEATNGFSQENMIGQGSYGSVYEGILFDGSKVAVKVLNIQSACVSASFKTECKILQKVRHRNLVRVLASCSEFNCKALVFDFMPNGSLERILYHAESGTSRDDHEENFGFLTRLSIATDVAYAIEYLHHDCFVQVIHCDIKPANVLLDENMTAHLTDFGVSRLIETSSVESLGSSASMKGTTGYIAPEFGLEGRLSTKCDVYSFGIMLLELLTRKRPTADIFGGDLSLPQWISSAYPDNLKEVIDHKLLMDIEERNREASVKLKFLASLCHIGLVCSRSFPQERPTMREVSRALQSLKEGIVQEL